MDKKSTNSNIACVRVALPVPVPSFRLCMPLSSQGWLPGTRPFGRSNKNRTAVSPL